MTCFMVGDIRQAELFMMRLARNSGIIGLAGMASVSYLYSRRPTSTSRTGVLLVRPLLQFRKQDLYAVCPLPSPFAVALYAIRILLVVYYYPLAACLFFECSQ